MSHLKQQALGKSAAPEIIIPQAFEPASDSVTQRARGFKPIFYAVAALLLIAGIALWYLFNAKSVVITTQPATSTVTVSGGFHLEMADHLLMMPGSYQLTATQAGHYPLKQEFDVTEVQNQQLNFNFERLPGTLKLAVKPQVALSVLLDGKQVALIDGQIETVAAGKHQLTISAPRYFTYQADIEITGMEQTQTLAIALTPAWAQVNIDSQPSGARVFNGGELLGITPITSQLLAGERQLTFEKSGYRTTERTITVVAGTESTIKPAKLFKLSGQLALSSTPAGVSVTYGDKYLGTTPLSAQVIPNKAQSLLLFKDGYQRQTHQLSVASGEIITKSFNLVPIKGTVTFKVAPADAKLYVNGQLKGRANQQLSLTAKQQKIRIERDGYVSYSANILPNASMKQQFSVKLKTLEQAAWANIKPLITASSGAKLKLFKPNDTFVMGTSRREQGRRANEAKRTVALTRAFYLGLTEVTNKEYRKFIQSHSSGHVKGNSLNGISQPVVNLNWFEAVTYCNWLSEQEKLTKVYQIEDNKVVAFNAQANGYRLPTEAEWAWTARYVDGQMLKYPWGNSLPPKKGAGNVADIAGAAILGYIQSSYNDKFVTTAPVASFPGNRKGIFDLSGNVAEWIHDYYQIKTGLSVSKDTDPMGATSGNYHVIRGASWAQGTRTQLRLAFRDYGVESRNDVGFRIARYAK